MNLFPSTQINLFGLNKYFLELSNLFDQNKFPNKILLSGEKGSGKCTLAYHLINYILSKDDEFTYNKKNYKKKIILIDRFVDSTIAYQHYGMGVDYSIINQINKFLLKNIKVDFTFLNTVNHKNMILRLKERKILNRYDKFNTSFYDKVQKGFLKLMRKKNKNSFMIVNSNLPINTNKEIVLKKIDRLI